MASAPGPVTQLLLAWKGSDRAALQELIPVVYPELRRIASRYLRRERIGHTLQPTALVHEAYVKLIDQRRAQWQNRAQFFGVAARRS
jgi:RNA polymerase sigma factor (TIGR02999 family)